MSNKGNKCMKEYEAAIGYARRIGEKYGRNYAETAKLGRTQV
jgi:hypothetical protein